MKTENNKFVTLLIAIAAESKHSSSIKHKRTVFSIKKDATTNDISNLLAAYMQHGSDGKQKPYAEDAQCHTLFFHVKFTKYQLRLDDMHRNAVQKWISGVKSPTRTANIFIIHPPKKTKTKNARDGKRAASISRGTTRVPITV